MRICNSKSIDVHPQLNHLIEYWHWHGEKKETETGSGESTESDQCVHSIVYYFDILLKHGVD